MTKAKKITFKGQEFLLFGDSEGPIATAEQYTNGEVSYAYLNPNGDIMRLKEKIGTIADCVIGGEVDVPDMTKASIIKMLERLTKEYT